MSVDKTTRGWLLSFSDLRSIGAQFAVIMAIAIILSGISQNLSCKSNFRHMEAECLAGATTWTNSYPQASYNASILTLLLPSIFRRHGPGARARSLTAYCAEAASLHLQNASEPLISKIEGRTSTFASSWSLHAQPCAAPGITD